MKAGTDETRCLISRKTGTVIDVLDPETGLTVCYGKDLDAVRATCPDAEEMTLIEFCTWKAQQQRTPMTWTETTLEQFSEMLGVLPPAAGTPGFRAFLVGEPFDHDALTGQPRYQGFRREENQYQVSSRPMTVAEFGALFGARAAEKSI